MEVINSIFNKKSEKIKKELKSINYNFKYTGTIYILESIKLIDYLKLSENFKLEKDIYPIIANKFGTDINNIKSSIVYATDKMYYDCDEGKLKDYLNLEWMLKPGPKDVIKAVLKRI